MEKTSVTEEPMNMDTQTLEVNIGPQHPSTHGVFRMNVVLDGENIVSLKPVMGYLHRNHEQIAENVSYAASMPYTDRLDYFNSMSNNLAYALAVEKLANVEVPERAEYIRVIMAELTRLVNHVSAIGFLLNDLGAFFTPVLYAFREREKILDVFEAVSGARMMCNYLRFGGVKLDFPEGSLEALQTILKKFPKFLDEFDPLADGCFLGSGFRGWRWRGGGFCLSRPLSGRRRGCFFLIFDCLTPCIDHGGICGSNLMKMLIRLQQIIFMKEQILISFGIGDFKLVIHINGIKRTRFFTNATVHTNGKINVEDCRSFKRSAFFIKFTHDINAFRRALFGADVTGNTSQIIRFFIV